MIKSSVAALLDVILEEPSLVLEAKPVLGFVPSAREGSYRMTFRGLFNQTKNSALAMTIPLYQTDAYLKQFDATVIAVEGNAAALDHTAFYPGGGGQPHDTGTLTSADKTWEVVQVHKSKTDALVWH